MTFNYRGGSPLENINARTKTVEIIKQNANALADWILSTNINITKETLPAEIQNLINLVENTVYPTKT